MNIAELLFAAARRSPDHPAVSDSGTTISYRGFVSRVAMVAGALGEGLGLRPHDHVVLYMENRREFLEVLFACWTAGAVAVPINARLHPNEVAGIAADAAASVIFTSSTLHAPLLPALTHPARVIAVDSDVYHGLSAELREVHPTAPEDLAWIFYTSGTTGRPKGAMLSHRNLLFMSRCYYADIDRLDQRDTMVHAAPLSHGSGLYALPHMFQGGHQVVLEGFDPDAVLDAIDTHCNVSFFAAPTMVMRLLDAPRLARSEIANLKTICYGGGPMYAADLARAMSVFGPRLYHLYGQGESPMTITGLGKSGHPSVDHPRRDELLGSCGYARTGVAVRVVDERHRPLPAGELGEVVTRSDCVMAGYWNDPKATAATLRGGWLHTGDIGMLAADGLLSLRDRTKDLIISGGSNIYPREIEEVLLRHPHVLECAVVGRPSREWGEEVVAFVVAQSGTTVSPEDLDRLCLENIARFKRPREYRFVMNLPKNNYGKVLKTELRVQQEAKSRVVPLTS